MTHYFIPMANQDIVGEGLHFPKEEIYKAMFGASVNMYTFRATVEIIKCLLIFINLVTHTYSRLDVFKHFIYIYLHIVPSTIQCFLRYSEFH